MKSFSALIPALLLSSCATIPVQVLPPVTPEAMQTFLHTQTRDQSVMPQWTAGALVVKVTVKDTTPSRARRLAYSYQLFVEQEQDGFRPSHVDMVGLNPRNTGTAAGIPGDETIDISDYIADGSFLTRWLPHDYVVDAEGKFVRYYSPYAFENLLEFRAQNRSQILAVSYPSFFTRDSNELVLLNESVSEAALLFQPRGYPTAQVYSTWTSLKPGQVTECVLDSPAAEVVRYTGSGQFNLLSGPSLTSQVSLEYNFGALGNIPTSIRCEEVFFSSSNRGQVFSRETQITITKRKF